jgi:hypothetical protein
MLGIATDITDRKFVEKSLLRKESESSKPSGLPLWKLRGDNDTQEVVCGRTNSIGLPDDRVARRRSRPKTTRAYPPEHWERIARAADEARRSGTPRARRRDLRPGRSRSGSRRVVPHGVTSTPDCRASRHRVGIAERNSASVADPLFRSPIDQSMMPPRDHRSEVAPILDINEKVLP